MEIGPGAGTLTTNCAKRPRRVWAIEVDSGWPSLEKTLLGCENVGVLMRTRSKGYPSAMEKEFDGGPFIVAAPALQHNDCLISRLRVGRALLQTLWSRKKVAQRMAATPGKKDYGSLTVMLNYSMKPEIMGIAPGLFFPEPKWIRDTEVTAREERL